MSNSAWWISVVVVGLFSSGWIGVEAHTLRDPSQAIFRGTLLGNSHRNTHSALQATSHIVGHSDALVDVTDYSQLLDAVQAAGQRYLEASVREDREYFGAVVRTAQGYYRLHGAAGAKRVDHFRFRISVSSGERLVAIWHTHGAPAEGRDYFSPADVAMVERLRYPMFLITPRGQINVLLPKPSGDPLTQTERAVWSDLLRAPIDFVPYWRRLHRGRPPLGAKKGVAVGRVPRGLVAI